MAYYTGLAIIVQDNEDEHETVEDPSPFTSYVLRCQDMPLNDQFILWWHSPTEPVPLTVEKELIDILIPYQRRERGMFYKQSYHRKRELRHICEMKNVKIRMALSLRRHHMRRMNPHLTLEQLHLGSEDVIRESARLFEVAVQEFLQRHNVTFYSEHDQRVYSNEHRQPGQPSPPTPDFILKKPIRIRKYKKSRGHTREIIDELSVSCTLRIFFQHSISYSGTSNCYSSILYGCFCICCVYRD
jgi:hypothetical protein